MFINIFFYSRNFYKNNRVILLGRLPIFSKNSVTVCMYKYNNFPVSFKIIKNENYSKKKYDSAYCPNISLLIKYFMCSVVLLFLGIQFFITKELCVNISLLLLQLHKKLLKIVDKTIFPQDFSNLSSNILAYKLIMNCVFI